MVTVIGLVFVPWTLLCILRGARHWVPMMLATSMPFVQGAAVTVSGNSVPPFFVVAFAPLFFVITGSRAPRVKGSLMLVTGFMATYMCLSAVLFPRIFAGLPVLVPRGGIDDQVADPGALALSISNLAQLVYLALGVGVVIFFARNRPGNLHFMVYGFGLGTVLNTWSLLAELGGIYFPDRIFHPVSSTQLYAEYFGTFQRFRGIYTEPSYQATFSLAAAMFAAYLISRSQGRLRLVAAGIVGLNLLELYFSFSGTALAGFFVTSGLVIAVYAWRFCTGKMRIPRGVLLGSCVAAVVCSLAYRPMAHYVRELLLAKVVSVSFTNRNESNSFSWTILRDTYGLGSGLGSSRPSSFAFLLLSTVGVIGTTLFAALVAVLVRRAVQTGVLIPESWCLIGTLVVKVIAEPNLSQPVMWLAMGACATAFSIRSEDERGTDGVGDRVGVVRGDLHTPGARQHVAG